MAELFLGNIPVNGQTLTLTQAQQPPQIKPLRSGSGAVLIYDVGQPGTHQSIKVHYAQYIPGGQTLVAYVAPHPPIGQTHEYRLVLIPNMVGSDVQSLINYAETNFNVLGGVRFYVQNGGGAVGYSSLPSGVGQVQSNVGYSGGQMSSPKAAVSYPTSSPPPIPALGRHHPQPYLSTSPLTEGQRKYCDCVLEVASKQDAVNPYAVCAHSTGYSVHACGQHLDFQQMDPPSLATFATLNHIKVADYRDRQAVLNQIFSKKMQEKWG